MKLSDEDKEDMREQILHAMRVRREAIAELEDDLEALERTLKKLDNNEISDIIELSDPEPRSIH